MAGLAAILAAIGDALPSEYFYAVGASEQARQGRPPRIVAVPGAEQLAAPHGTVSHELPGKRRFLCRESMVTFFLWGKDLAATELLVDELLRAIHYLTPGAYKPGSGAWDNDQSSSTLGSAYRLTVTFLIPVQRHEPGRVVTAMPVTGEIT